MVDSLAAALTELQRYVNEDLRDSLKVCMRRCDAVPSN